MTSDAAVGPRRRRTIARRVPPTVRPSRDGRDAGRARRAARRRSQHAIFSVAHRPLAHRRAGPRDRRRELLRHQRRRSSAFTIAFQVPNLVRALVADAALSSRVRARLHRAARARTRKEAFRLASTLFCLILVALGAITRALHPARAGDHARCSPATTFTPQLDDLTRRPRAGAVPDRRAARPQRAASSGSSTRYDHFTIPAIAPLVWNLVIIAVLVVLAPLFHGDDQLYAYAIGVLVGHDRAAR